MEAGITKLKAEPFVTEGLDIESYFIKPEYLAVQNQGIGIESFQDLISSSLTDDHDDTVAAYVNGRTNIARENKTTGALNPGALAVEAQKEVTGKPASYARKRTLRTLRQRFKSQYDRTLQIGAVTEILKVDELAQIAQRVKKSKTQDSS